MAADWYHQSRGIQAGPLDSGELRRLAEAGIVRPETLVRQGDGGRWVRAEQVRGLFQRCTPARSPSLGASPPPPTVPPLLPPPLRIAKPHGESRSEPSPVPAPISSARVIACCIVLLFFFGAWIVASKKIGWVITSVLATIMDVPAGPMNPAQAGRWAMVGAVIAGMLIVLGFALGCWVFDRVKKAPTETPLGKDNPVSGRDKARQDDGGPAVNRNFLAIASAMSGFIALASIPLSGLFVGIFPAVFAIGLAIFGLKSEGRRWAIVGIVCGCITLLITVALVVLVVFWSQRYIQIITQALQAESARSFPSKPGSRDGVAPSVGAPVATEENRNPSQVFTAASADARSHYLRGLAAAQNHKDFEAVQQFTEAIRIDADYAEAYVARGCVRLCSFNEHDLAVEDHTKAISLQPEYVLAYFHRADTYWDAGRNQDALKDCDNAISLAPRFAQAFELRARVLEGLGERERARTDWERTKELGFCEDAPWYPWEDTSWQPWQEVAVPGVCKFTIPPTLEVQGRSFADLAGELRHGMFGPDDPLKRVVIQPRGVNEFKFDTYARVIVEVWRNPEEPGLTQEELRAVTPAYLREVDEVLKQTTIQQLNSTKGLGREARFLEWYPSKIVCLDNIYALWHGCRRQLGDNPPVQVQGYRVPIEDFQCEITVSFRESERSKWATDLEKVVSSFRFEHREK